MKFLVELTRISYARQTIQTEVDTVQQAKELAMKQAPEEDFSTYDNEYEISWVRVAKE